MRSISVAVITCDRPAALDRCLRSLKRQGRLNRSSVQPFVFDNSRTPTAMDHNRVICASLGGRYVGATQRTRLLRSLQATGVPAGTARFAVSPEWRPAIGANRNVALLAFAGRLFASLDDDVLASRFVPIDASSCVSVTRTCRRLRAPDWGSQFDRQFRAVEGGVVDAFASLKWSVTVAGAPPVDIRVATAGARGRDTMGWPTDLLMVTGDSRARLLASEEVYRKSYCEGFTSAVVLSSTLCSAPSLSGHCFAADGRGFLVPFFPHSRVEETCFSSTLAACDPTAWTMYLPDTVLHTSTRPVRSVDDIWIHTRPRLLHVLAELIETLEPIGVSAEERCVSLGRQLRAAASEGPAAFRERWSWAWSRRVRRRLEAIAALRWRYGERPHYWSRDLARHTDGLVRSAEDCANAFPVDVAPPGEAACWSKVAEWVFQFGSLLEAWPLIWRWAKTDKAWVATAVWLLLGWPEAWP